MSCEEQALAVLVARPVNYVCVLYALHETLEGTGFDEQKDLCLACGLTSHSG